MLPAKWNTNASFSLRNREQELLHKTQGVYEKMRCANNQLLDDNIKECHQNQW